MMSLKLLEVICNSRGLKKKKKGVIIVNVLRIFFDLSQLTPEFISISFGRLSRDHR